VTQSAAAEKKEKKEALHAKVAAESAAAKKKEKKVAADAKADAEVVEAEKKNKEVFADAKAAAEVAAAEKKVAAVTKVVETVEAFEAENQVTADSKAAIKVPHLEATSTKNVAEEGAAVDQSKVISDVKVKTTDMRCPAVFCFVLLIVAVFMFFQLSREEPGRTAGRKHD
jgi:colicin import membrane protein